MGFPGADAIWLWHCREHCVQAAAAMLQVSLIEKPRQNRLRRGIELSVAEACLTKFDERLLRGRRWEHRVPRRLAPIAPVGFATLKELGRNENGPRLRAALLANVAKSKHLIRHILEIARNRRQLVDLSPHWLVDVVVRRRDARVLVPFKDQSHEFKNRLKDDRLRQRVVRCGGRDPLLGVSALCSLARSRSARALCSRARSRGARGGDVLLGRVVRGRFGPLLGRVVLFERLLPRPPLISGRRPSRVGFLGQRKNRGTSRRMAQPRRSPLLLAGRNSSSGGRRAFRSIARGGERGLAGSSKRRQPCARDPVPRDRLAAAAAMPSVVDVAQRGRGEERDGARGAGRRERQRREPRVGRFTRHAARADSALEPAATRVMRGTKIGRARGLMENVRLNMLLEASPERLALDEDSMTTVAALIFVPFIDEGRAPPLGEIGAPARDPARWVTEERDSTKSASRESV